jgi:hypothetical protein
MPIKWMRNGSAAPSVSTALLSFRSYRIHQAAPIPILNHRNNAANSYSEAGSVKSHTNHTSEPSSAFSDGSLSVDH